MTQYYGHTNTIRKAITAFMSLFNDLYIEKYRTDGKSNLYRVPIQFVNREKFLSQLESKVHFASDHDDSINGALFELDMILPRMSVNMVALTYDPQRKIGKTQKVLSCDAGNNLGSIKREFVYAPAPWNLELELAVISKNVDDGLQIIEQIIPFFQPSLNVNIKILDNFESVSVPIILDSITPNHDEEMDESGYRFFVWILNFRMKLSFFPIRHIKGTIKDILVNVHPNEYDNESDIFTQYQLNAEKIVDISDSTSYFVLQFDRDTKSININQRNTFVDTTENIGTESFSFIFFSSEGGFDHTSTDFYLQDLAGSFAWHVKISNNVIKITKDLTQNPLLYPQIYNFKEVLTGETFAMGITAGGGLDISKV